MFLPVDAELLFDLATAAAYVPGEADSMVAAGENFHAVVIAVAISETVLFGIPIAGPAVVVVIAGSVAAAVAVFVCAHFLATLENLAAFALPV